MICTGRIVKSKAGHDREDFFVVIATQGEFALIADGKHRKLQNPKKKNQKHLAPTTELVDGITTDKQLRIALRAYRNNHTETEIEGGFDLGER